MQPIAAKSLIVVAVFAMWSNTAIAQLCSQVKVMPDDAHCGGEFGVAVAIEGDVLVVGSPESGVVLKDPGPGAAYVFRRNGGLWVQEQKLSPADLADGDRFAMSLALSGTAIIVGASEHTVTAGRDGAAYVFRHDGSTWVQEQKLVPSDPLPLGHFGGSVAIDGDVAAISAIHETFGGGNESGAVYVFRRSGGVWTQEQKLTGADAGPFAHTSAVSIQGNVIVFGAPGMQAAYVFRWIGSTWTQEQKLTPSDGPRPFASATAIDGDVILIGSDRDDAPFQDSGSAYVFRRIAGTWVQQQKLTPSDPSEFGHFGWSVTLQSITAAIGAFGANAGAGALYVFREGNGTWTQSSRLTAPDGFQNDSLGRSVGIDDCFIVGGSPTGNDACPGDPFGFSGETYVFDAPFCPQCIPALSSVGLAVFAITLVVAATMILARRRASVANGSAFSFQRSEKKVPKFPPPPPATISG